MNKWPKGGNHFDRPPTNNEEEEEDDDDQIYSNYASAVDPKQAFNGSHMDIDISAIKHINEEETVQLRVND